MSWRKLYPFASRFITLSSGHRLHYVDEGHGRCLLLLHGNPTWSFHYRKVMEYLRSDHRVIALDHLGCGFSDKPPQYNYCLEQHTTNALELLEQLDLHDVTIVGHDWGGAISANAVRQQPARFQRIVLLNTGAFPPPRIPWRIAVCRTPVLGPLAVRGMNVFVRAALHMTMVDSSRLSPDERAGILAPYDGWKNRVGVQRFIDDIPFTTRHRAWHVLSELEQALPSFSIPKLLIWGLRDWCFDGDCLDRFISIWPDATVVRFEDAGHWVVEEKAEPIARRIADFVSPSHAPSTIVADGVSS